MPRLAPHRLAHWLAASVVLLAATQLACATAAPAVVPSPRSRECRDPAITVRNTAWDDARHLAVAHAFDTLPGSPSAGPRLAARLDAHALEWTRARAQTCRAAHTHAISSDLFTAAAACQQGVLMQMAALAVRIRQAPADSLSRADAGIDELEDALARCARPDTLARYHGDRPYLAAQTALTVAELAITMQDGSWAQAIAHRASEPEVAPDIAARLRPQVQLILAWASWLRGQDQNASARLGKLRADDPLTRARLAELRLFTRGLDDPAAIADGAAALTAYHRLLGPRDRRLVRVHRELARRHRLAGRLDAASAELDAALDLPGLGPDDPLRAALDQQRGDLEHLRGDYRSAALHHQAALDVRARSIGSEQLLAAESLFGLGADLEALGHRKLALDAYTRALKIQRTLAPDELSTARTYNNLGRVAYSARDFADARRFHQAALTIRQRRLGVHSPETATSLNNLGALALAEGDLPGAQKFFKDALDIRQRLLGPDHPYTAISLNNLGELYTSQGRIADAIASHERALAIRRARFGDDHPETARSAHNLGVLLMRRDLPGDLDRARALLTAAGDTRAARLGPDHLETLSTLRALAELAELAEPAAPPAPAPPAPRRPRR